MVFFCCFNIRYRYAATIYTKHNNLPLAKMLLVLISTWGGWGFVRLHLSSFFRAMQSQQVVRPKLKRKPKRANTQLLNVPRAQLSLVG